MKHDYTKGKSGQISDIIQNDPRIKKWDVRASINALHNRILRYSLKFGFAYLTNETLSEMMGCKPLEIRRTLKFMEELNYILISYDERKDNNGNSMKDTRGITLTVRKIYPQSIAKIEETIKKLINSGQEIKGKYKTKPRKMKESNSAKSPITIVPLPQITIANKEELVEEKEYLREKQEIPILKSIREKAIEQNPNILFNEEGQQTSVVFGKGFNKYSEDLYEL